MVLSILLPRSHRRYPPDDCSFPSPTIPTSNTNLPSPTSTQTFASHQVSFTIFTINPTSSNSNMPVIDYSADICAALLNATAIETQQPTEPARVFGIGLLLAATAGICATIPVLWLWLWWRDQPWCKHDRGCRGGYFDARGLSRLCQHDFKRVWKIMQEEELRRRSLKEVPHIDDANSEAENAANDGYQLVGVELGQ